MPSIVPWFVSRVAFPLYHFLKRDGLLQAIADLDRTQWLTGAELRELQADKLSRLLRHCADNVPYYGHIFDRMGYTAGQLNDYERFRRIPFLTKSLINANLDGLRATDGSVSDLVKNSTSGSTGEPLVFYNDRRSLRQRQAVVVRNQAWVSALYSDREARLWGAQMDLNRLLTWRGRLHGFVHNTLQLSSYELSDTSMRQYVKILNRFRPKLLISYPSPLAEFSRFLLDNRLRIPSITSIITSAEMLFDWQRELIGQAFDAPLFDRYGCREFGNIAHECEAHEGYHVNSERFVLEILDEDGHPVAPGESGNLYVTDLDNLGFPFLRYEIGDMACRSDAQCACGRGLPLIARLEGRSFDIVRCPDGGRVAGTFWTICLRRFPGVVRFQVVQERIDLLTIRLLTDDRYDRASEAPMTTAIQDKCGAGMHVRYEYVERIESTASGKQRFVASRLQGT